MELWNGMHGGELQPIFDLAVVVTLTFKNILLLLHQL